MSVSLKFSSIYSLFRLLNELTIVFIINISDPFFASHTRFLNVVIAGNIIFFSLKYSIEFFIKNKESLFLKEWTRDKKYHVLDTESGSVIFRPYVISLFKEFSLLSNIKFFIINTIFIDDDQVNLICELVSDLKNDKIDASIVEKKLEETFTIEDGFIYEDSIYNPEEF